MTEIVILLTGILMAAFLFAATFFSAAQIYRQTGRLRLVHGVALGATLAGMAALSSELWLVSRIAGGVLAASGATAAILERGSNRLLPLIQVAFGAALLAGLPFGG